MADSSSDSDESPAEDLSLLGDGGRIAGEKIRMILQAGTDVNAMWSDGQTTLILAAALGDTELIRTLLDAGADVNLKGGGPSHCPPDALSSAAKAGNLEAIRLLLEAGAKVNPEIEGEGTNALFFAVSYDHIDAVRLLLGVGSWVNVSEEESFSPLILSARNASVEIMRLLLAAGAGAHVNQATTGANSGISALTAASESTRNRAEMLQMLLVAGATFRYDSDPDNDSGQMALDYAAADGDINSLRLLELTGVYTDSRFARHGGPKALGSAARFGHAAAVQFLMDKGADIHVVDYITGLNAVMQAGNQEVLDILLKAGARISSDEARKAWVFLHAVCHDNIALSRALVAAGVDINAQNSDERKTPLFFSISSGKANMSTLPFLIALGANLELRDIHGHTALIFAAERNNTYAVGQLVRAGADLNVVCSNSFTSLTHAVLNANREMVCILVRAGAEVCAATQPYVNAMHRFIATVLSVLPSNFPLVLRQDILTLVLEQHDGRFLE